MSVELLSASEDVCAEEMTAVCRTVVADGRAPDDWKNSSIVPLYKGKGDARLCCKHRGIKLLEHEMKVYEKVVEARLRDILQIDGCQFGFMKGRSTIDAIYIVIQVQEKYREKRKKLFHVSVYLERSFDRVPRKVIEWALRRQSIPKVKKNGIG